MSSGTDYNPSAGFQAGVAAAVDTRMLDTSRQLGMTERQRRLQGLWARYCALQYADRKVAWDGTKAPDPEEVEQIGSLGYLPPGYYDANNSTMPLKFRKPSAPYHLFRVIVDRFTGLLFSQRKHPRIRIGGSPEAEDFVRALAETARLWPAMMRARTYGGAMGTVAVGFQILDGRPTIQVYDTRWLFPEFADRFTLRLSAVEQRMMYWKDERDEKGDWQQVPYWFRRVIDARSDTTFLPVRVDPEIPERDIEWVPDPGATHDHNLGFCPVVWVQNVPVDDDVDGAADCEGILDDLEALDQVLSQVQRGTVANTDPTLVLATDGEMGQDVRTGSDNAIKLPKDGKATYLEMAGSSLEIGLKVAAELRRVCLEVAQCVLDGSDADPTMKTATEVNRRYSAMFARGDVLREQYGERAVVPVLQMMYRACLKLAVSRDTRTGNPIRGGVRLRGWKGARLAGGMVAVPTLPDGGEVPDVELLWPEYTEPSFSDVQTAAGATAVAKAASLIDKKTAAEFVAPLFRVEDVGEMLAKIDEEEQAQGDEAARSIGALNAANPRRSQIALATGGPAPGTVPPKPGTSGGAWGT